MCRAMGGHVALNSVTRSLPVTPWSPGVVTPFLGEREPEAPEAGLQSLTSRHREMDRQTRRGDP